MSNLFLFFPQAGNNLALFYMNPYTCDVYVNGLLDFESKKTHNLKIVATDNDPDNPKSSDVVTMKVSLIDENDSGPVSYVMFTNSFTLFERGFCFLCHSYLEYYSLLCFYG